MDDAPDFLTGDEKIIARALKRFKLADLAERDNREIALQCLKLRLNDQNVIWGSMLDNRRQQNRPCLSVPRVAAFTRHVTNDIRQNRPSIKVVATDDDTVDTAEVIEGMIRHIQESSDANIAYDTASDHQVTMGFGYIRVITDYVDDTSFDQEIKISRIKNPFSVYFDPAAVQPDYSDAMWCIVVANLTHDEYENEYGKDETWHAANEFRGTGNAEMGWMDQKNIRIAEYFEVEEDDENIHLLDDGSVVTDDELGKRKPKESRKRKKRTVKWYKLSANKILDQNEWPGIYIPIVPVLGEDFDVDGERRLKGMVEDMMDSQRMLDFYTSAEAEAIALAPKAPWLIAEGQIQGYENIWNQANIMNYPFLPYRPITLDGNIVGQPSRIQAEPPVQAMAASIAQAEQNMKSITGIYDASLGSRSNETSGRAIAQRQQQGENANFHYSDNQGRAAKQVGRICIDLIPKIYTKKRIVRVVKPDETPEMVKINQPSGKMDKEGNKQKFDLTKDVKYDVVIDVGPSFATKRQQAQDAMSSLVASDPNLMAIAGDIIVKQFDFPYAQELAERIKKGLPPQFQDPPDGQQQLPPQVMQKIQQSGQMIEEMTKTIHALQDQLDSKDKELQSKERIAAMNNEAGITEAVIRSGADANLQLAKMEIQANESWRNHALDAAQLGHTMDQAAVQNDQQQQQLDAQQQAPEQAEPNGAV